MYGMGVLNEKLPFSFIKYKQFINNCFTIYFPFIIVFIFTITSCQKQLDSYYFDLNTNENEMFYRETQCADPWYELLLQKENSHKTKVEVLDSFLSEENISFLNLVYKKENDANIVTCTECQCFTGSTYYIKIINDKSIIDKLEDIGFVKQ